MTESVETTYTIRLPLAAIRVDPRLQMRARMDDDAVEEYRQIYAAQNGQAAVLPPLSAVREVPKKSKKVPEPEPIYWLYDGFHRLSAAELANMTEIDLTFTDGTFKTARQKARSANHAHGVRLSSACRRKIVLSALEDNPRASSRSIARECCVSDFLVRTIREELDNPGATAEPQEPASSRTPASDSTAEEGARSRTPENTNSPEYAGEEGTSGYSEPDSDSASQTDPEESLPPITTDPAGLPIPPGLQGTFAAGRVFDAIDALLGKAQKLVHELAVSPGGDIYKDHLIHKGRSGSTSIRHHSAPIKDAQGELRSCRPYACICPYCQQQGGSPSDDCRCCQGRGWVTESAWDNAPVDFRTLAAAIRKTEGYADADEKDGEA